MNETPIDWSLPPRYEKYLSEEGYERLIQLCLDHLEGRAIVHAIEKGIIKLGLGDISEMECALDNLVRQIRNLPEPSWRERVIEHFGQLWLTLADHDEYLKVLQDFEQAKTMLRLRVYPDSFGNAAAKHELVSRVDFPGTFTCLVIDYDNRYQLLTRNIAAMWETSEQELFHFAQQNINKEKVTVNRIEVNDGPDVYTILNSESAVSYLLDFESNAQFANGEHGCLVAIPSKSAAFCVPIIDDNYTHYLRLLSPLVRQFYDQGQGQINPDFYWYYKGTFRRFGSEKLDTGQIDYIAPEELLELFL